MILFFYVVCGYAIEVLCCNSILLCVLVGGKPILLFIFNQESGNNKNNTGINHNKPYIVVPYVKGMSDSCKNICIKHGIEM